VLVFLFDNEFAAGRLPTTSLPNDRDEIVAAVHRIETGIARRCGKGREVFVHKKRFAADGLDPCACGLPELGEPFDDGTDEKPVVS